MFGGADTYNMLVPLHCPRYQDYRNIRRTVALDPEDLIEITTEHQSCEEFGIHSSLGYLKTLYDAGEGAFVSNVGDLVEPILGINGARNCPGLFSHNDMQQASQTLYCQMGPNFKHGGGGRMADALANGGGFTSTSFSLAGKSVWAEGETTKRKVISGNSGVEGGFRPNTKVQRIVDNITSVEFSTVYAKEYVRQIGDTLRSYESVSEALRNGDRLLARPDLNYGAMQEFKQVARLIAARDERRAERDFFFVGIGGWDMHTNLKPNLAMRFEMVNQGIQAFVTEMKAQNMWENVVLASQSDFARTLDPNANLGTDHGWAGIQFVLSGSLQGGKVYNDFPSLEAGNEADVGRGRLKPKYPYESYMVPIAKFLGVEDSYLDVVFPNLGNFNETEHIIPNLFSV